MAKRLKEGVFDSEGKRFVPKVVRIGAEYSINVSVSEVFLDNLVEKALAKENGQSTAAESASLMSSMRTEMSKYRAEREEKRTEKNNMVNNTSMVVQLSMEITSLTQKIDDLAERLDRERDRMTQANRASDAARKRIRAEILADADVICSTLSGSGHEYLANYDFETVIIDEAAQSVEISSLIPLKYNCQRCIMVGGEWIVHLGKAPATIAPCLTLLPFNRSQPAASDCQVERGYERRIQPQSFRPYPRNCTGSDASAEVRVRIPTFLRRGHRLTALSLP